MGIIDSISSWFATDVYAEEPAEQENDASPEEESKDEPEEEPAEEDAAEEEEDEEEEEEEEEPVDPKEEIEAACAKTAACRPAVEHYEHCAARVTGQIENEGGAKEDCVEEFFHMTHCVAQCAAPKLFKQLK